MKSELTLPEREQLNIVIHDARTYSNRKLRELVLLISVSTIIGIIFSISKYNFNLRVVLVFFALGLVMILLLILVWILAGTSIKKLEKDLESGMKLIGSSKIKSINLNRKIKLSDGTVVYQSDAIRDKWKKGDNIYYRTTLSGEHQFECKKV